MMSLTSLVRDSCPLRITFLCFCVCFFLKILLFFSDVILVVGCRNVF